MRLINKNLGQIAQLVEHGIENPGVAGSIPALPTTYSSRKNNVVFPILFSINPSLFQRRDLREDSKNKELF